MSAETRVAVIGAGVAGATAAYRLRQAGVSPVVFEAEDDVGGQRPRALRRRLRAPFSSVNTALVSGQAAAQRITHNLGASRSGRT